MNTPLPSHRRIDRSARPQNPPSRKPILITLAATIKAYRDAPATQQEAEEEAGQDRIARNKLIQKINSRRLAIQHAAGRPTLPPNAGLRTSRKLAWCLAVSVVVAFVWCPRAASAAARSLGFDLADPIDINNRFFAHHQWGYYNIDATSWFAAVPTSEDYCYVQFWAPDLTTILPGFTAGVFLVNGGTVNESGPYTISDTEYIFNGGAIVQQNFSSTTNTTANLVVGMDANNAPSAGSYTVALGTLSAGNAYIGGDSTNAGGPGVLNVSVVNSVPPSLPGAATISGKLKVWNTPGTAVNLTGGTLTVGTLDLSGNNSRLNWTSGTLAFTNTPTLTVNASSIFGTSLVLGPNKGLSSTGNLVVPSGSSVTVAGGSLSPAPLSINAGGAVTQTSGTVSPGSMKLGNGAGIAATYTLSNGTLTDGGLSEFIGYSGAGTFTQTGGTNSVTFNLRVGYTSSGIGTYLMHGGNLNTRDIRTDSGHGTFTMDGGTVTFSGNHIRAGIDAGSVANYTFTGGTVSNTSTGYITVGESGTGSLSIGGNAVVSLAQTNGNNLRFGWNASGVGSVHVYGSASLNVWDIRTDSGHGTFLQDDGAVTVGGWLRLGVNAGSVATYTLNLGQLNLGLMAQIGENGSGTLNINGGTITVVQNMNLGLGAGSGTVIQSAGTNSITGGLFVGANAGGNGTYSLSGTGALAAAQVYVGYSGSGVFNQTGGTNTVRNTTNSLIIGQNSGSDGTYNLSGGSLSVTSANANYVSEIIGGSGGIGRFVQTGGNHEIQTLLLGVGSASTGTFELSGGTVTTTIDEVGGSGVGSFAQSGGTHTLTGVGTLKVGSNAGSTGTYSLSGTGVLSANQESVGVSGAGVFNQTGGTNTIINSGDLVLGNSAGSNGSYNASGGTVSGRNLIVGQYGVGSLVIDGGALTFASLQANNGKGSINFKKGTVNATNATINIGANGLVVGDDTNVAVLTLGNGTHSVTNGIHVRTGSTLSLSLSQAGGTAVDLQGGTLNGIGTIGVLSTSGSSQVDPSGITASTIATGNVQLTTGTTFHVDLTGAGTNDWLNVAGTVNLGGATLDVRTGFTPTLGQTFTIIQNDAADAVIGTFAGLPEGALFTLTASNGSGPFAFSISYHGGDGNDVVVTVGTQMDVWRVQTFGGNAHITAISGDLADPEGDGVKNIFEYGLGGEPLAASPALLPQMSVEGQHLKLSFQRDSSLYDLTYTVQATFTPENTASWIDIAAGANGAAVVSLVGGSVTVSESGAGTLKQVTVRDSADIGLDARRFLRLELKH